MSGISLGTDFPMYVSMAGNNVSTAYLGGSNTSSEPIVLKTTNAGASWTHVFNTANNANIVTGWSGDGGDRGWSYGEVVLGMAVAPANPSRIVITDLGYVHLSSNGGAT